MMYSNVQMMLVKKFSGGFRLKLLPPLLMLVGSVNLGPPLFLMLRQPCV